MKIHWAGKFDGREESLPQREHPEGAVPFKEAKNMNIFAVVANIASIVVMLAFLYLTVLRNPDANSLLGFILSIVSLVPHEYLHGLWIPGDSYVYTNLKKGMLMVTGTSDMTKGRYIIMSLFPNIVFGFVPFLLYMLFPIKPLYWAGTMGAACLGMGIGDYYNVFNAAVQMPKGALTYLSGFHSYWYMPENINS